MTNPNEQQYWLEVLQKELYTEVIPWWLHFSIDKDNGGFFNCLHEDGSLYDKTKYVWLQGRQVWMFAKLYGDPSFNEALLCKGNTLDAITKESLLTIAISGAKFLIDNAIKEDDGHVWFSLQGDGTPMQMQRKPWGACFLVMGLFELARVMPDSMADEADVFYQKGIGLFESILKWFADPCLLGSKFGPGQPETSSLAVPMILLNLCHEIRAMVENFSKAGDASHRFKNDDKSFFRLIDTCNQKEEWCIKEIQKHVKYDSDGNVSKVLETVGVHGEEIDTPAGRLINPGHVIEAGWFLMQYSEKNKVQDSKNKPKTFELGKALATWALDIGWDEQFGGGILYFLDASKRFSPIELEWDHKLWWPHTESLIAFIMAFEKTGKAEDWERFKKVAEYIMKNFKDKERGGEWYGYLNRRGELTHRFKGGPYKGCFHVPRALWMCINILNRICLRNDTE